MSSPTQASPRGFTAPEPPPRKMRPLDDPRVAAAALTVIVLTGLAIRTYQLADRSLWFDEAFSWRVIQFPLPEMIERVGRDIHPPLHFLLLKGWAAVFGDSAFALRSLSVLCGGLTIFGVYAFAVEAFGRSSLAAQTRSDFLARGRGIGLLAAALVAFSALQIRYSQEARMYSLATALAVFSSWTLFRALRPPSRLRLWLLYGMSALLLAYTHYYGLFTLAGQAVFVAVLLLVRADWNGRRVLRDPAFRHAVLAATIVFVGWLPWLSVFLRQLDQAGPEFISHWDVARLCYNLFAVQDQFFNTSPRRLHLLAAGFCILILVLLCYKARAAEWYLLWSAVAPLVCALTVSAPLVLRYFIMAHLFLLLGLAVVVWRMPFRAERAVLIATTLMVFAGFYFDYWRDLDAAHRPGTRGAAAFLHEHRRPGEPVLVSRSLFYFPLLHYTPDRAGYYLYGDGSPLPYFLGTAALTPEDLIFDEQVQALHSPRVWVVNLVGSYVGDRAVPVPAPWVEKSRRSFSDVGSLGEAVVVEYATAGGS